MTILETIILVIIILGFTFIWYDNYRLRKRLDRIEEYMYVKFKDEDIL